MAPPGESLAPAIVTTCLFGIGAFGALVNLRLTNFRCDAGELTLCFHAGALISLGQILSYVPLLQSAVHQIHR